MLAVAQLGEHFVPQDTLQLGKGSRGGAAVKDSVVIEQSHLDLAALVNLTGAKRCRQQGQGMGRGGANAGTALHAKGAQPTSTPPSRPMQAKPPDQPSQRAWTSAEVQRLPEAVDVFDWLFLQVPQPGVDLVEAQCFGTR